MSPQPTLEELAAQVQSLRAELDARRRMTRSALTVLALAGVVTATGYGIAWAAGGVCAGGMPHCFAQNTPAIAADVNDNFTHLSNWLLLKTGDAGTPNISTSGSATIGNGIVSPKGLITMTGPLDVGAYAGGKLMYLSGNIGPASGGFEIRHDNQTQGVGLGYNTVYATGTWADQPLYLQGNGAGGVQVQSDLKVPNNAWGSGPTKQPTVGGRGGTTDSTSARCPNGQYVCGIYFGPSYNQNWWIEQYGVECCGL